MYCPKCGKDNLGDARFCKACGEKLPLIPSKKLEQNDDTMICPSCRMSTPRSSKFCKACGTPILQRSSLAQSSKDIHPNPCPQCKTNNVSTAQFCRICGHKLASKSALPSQAPLVSPVQTEVQQSSGLADKIAVAHPEQPHCATVLLLDTSGSMVEKNKIKQLNDGLRLFKSEVSKDDLARRRVDVAIITFGESAYLAQPFTSIEEFEPPTLQANGQTAMGQAILHGINLIEERKQVYRDQGIDYFRPWIFLITDGEPTDMKPSDALWNQVVDRIRDCEINNKLLFFAVGVDPANMTILSQILPPSRGPIKLRPGNFQEMFQWLSNSHEKVVKQDLKPGEMVRLDPPTGWGEVPL